MYIIFERFLSVLNQKVLIYVLDDNNEEEDKVEDLNELYEEAEMPLEDILMKYKNNIIEKINNAFHNDDQPGSSKESSNSSSQNSESTSKLDHNFLFFFVLKCGIVICLI